jgi:hypothetical protein
LYETGDLSVAIFHGEAMAAHRQDKRQTGEPYEKASSAKVAKSLIVSRILYGLVFLLK